jgi:putative Holliday junction resolvase
MANPVDLATLKAAHKPGMRLLGIDPGSKTLGLALSDGLLTVASPLRTLARGKFAADAAQLAKIVASQGVFGFVIGLPLNMDGSEGPRAQSARALMRNLAQFIDLPMAFWDERLTTAAAERALLEADMSRRKRDERIDAVAASLILQGALDRMRNL